MSGRKRHRKKKHLFRAGQAIAEAFVWDFRRLLAAKFHLADVARETMAALCGPDESFPIVLEEP